MMIVLEKVSATETYAALRGDMPMAMAMTNPISDVNTICPKPVARATGPVVRIRFKSSLSPTINSRRAMPIWARSSICS